MKYRPGPKEQKALEDRMIQSVKHRSDQGYSGEQRMPRHAEDQSSTQPHENDANVLDAVVGQEPFEIVLHQGVQDAEKGGDNSHDEHCQARPGWHASQVIEENARPAEDAGI